MLVFICISYYYNYHRSEAECYNVCNHHFGHTVYTYITVCKMFKIKFFSQLLKKKRNTYKFFTKTKTLTF